MYKRIINKLDRKNIPVLVAAHNVGSLGIIYPLVEKGIDVIAISHEKFLISSLEEFGIYIEDKKNWFDEIKKIGNEYKSKYPYKKMIFLTDGDMTMDQMVQHYEEIKDNFILPIGNNIESYLNGTNKKLLPKYVKSVKLPKTYEGEEQYLIDDFPVISKQISSYYKKPKEKVFVSNNKEELVKNLKILSEIGGSITQEIIDGNTESLYCITMYRNKYGYVIIGNVVRKNRELPIINGTGSCHETVENREIVEKSIKVLDEINYSGVAMIEFKYSKKYDDYVLIEINGRFPIETNINSKLENDFVFDIYNDIIENSKERKVVFKSKEKRAYWVLKSYDIRACLKNKINPFSEYNKYSKELVDAVKDYNNPKTYSTYKNELLKKACKKVKRIVLGR